MKKRIEWVDICKGLVMILTVCMHCGLSAIPYVRELVNIFYMPLFFIASGFFMKPEKYSNLMEFVSNRWYTLYRPFIIFFVLVMSIAKLFNEEQVSWLQYTVNTIKWGGEGMHFGLYQCWLFLKP